MKSLLMRPSLSNDDINVLIGFAKDNGGIDYAFATMRRMQEEAGEVIARYPDSQWKRSFIDIFDFIISRDR